MPRLAALLEPLVPRPITDRAYWQRLASASEHALWRDAVLEQVAKLPAQPPHILASDLLAARRVNDRRRSDHIIRDLRGGLAALAMRRCLLGDGEDDQLLDWLWAQLHQPSWSLISHLPNHDLPHFGQPHIDLSTAMTGIILVELVELLRPWLDAQSPHLAPSILDRVDAEILTPFGDGWGDQGWWSNLEKVHNNWTGVCAGGMLAMCHSMARQGRPRPVTQARCLALVARFLHAGFTPSGECDEGPGYWSYGMAYACAGLTGMTTAERAAALDLDRLRTVARYPEQAWLFGDTFYASNDAGDTLRPNLQCTGWLAAVCDDAFLHAWSAHRGRLISEHLGLCWRLPCIVDALTAEAVPPWPPASRPLIWLADQHAAILRHQTGDTRWLLSLAGGHNAEAHNHNDVGHVNVWLHDTPVLIDIGKPDYTADMFGPRRYTYLANNSFGHNVPLIGGHAQRTGRDAGAVILAGPDASGLTLNITAAYPPEAGCVRWVRQLQVHEDGATLIDSAELAPQTAVELRYWTRTEPVVHGDHVDIGPLRLQVPSAKLRVQHENPAAHRLSGDHLWCISIDAQADTAGALHVVTTLTAR